MQPDKHAPRIAKGSGTGAVPPQHHSGGCTLGGARECEEPGRRRARVRRQGRGVAERERWKRLAQHHIGALRGPICARDCSEDARQIQSDALLDEHGVVEIRKLRDQMRRVLGFFAIEGAVMRGLIETAGLRRVGAAWQRDDGVPTASRGGAAHGCRIRDEDACHSAVCVCMQRCGLTRRGINARNLPTATPALQGTVRLASGYIRTCTLGGINCKARHHMQVSVDLELRTPDGVAATCEDAAWAEARASLALHW
eukprot:6180096-Pleurochrysis_carterae.AAC.1